MIKIDLFHSVVHFRQAIQYAVCRTKRLINPPLTIGCLLFIGLNLPAVAHATEHQNSQASSSDEYRWYVKGALGTAFTLTDTDTINDDFTDAGLDLSVGDLTKQSFTYGIGLGYWINSNWALEAGYLSIGGFDAEFLDAGGNPTQLWQIINYHAGDTRPHPDSGEGYYGSALYRWNIVDQWRAYAKLGLFFWDNGYDAELAGGNTTYIEGKDSTDLIIGSGVDYRLDSRWEVGAGVDFMQLEHHDILNFQLNVSYRFDVDLPWVTTFKESITTHFTSEESEISLHDAACMLYAGRLDQIQYETGSSQLSASSMNVLTNIAVLFQELHVVDIRIEAHTDSVGSESANTLLSLERADAVKQFLVKQGIKSNRITTSHYGEKRPIADNNTADGRRKNRRVNLQFNFIDHFGSQYQKLVSDILGIDGKCDQ